MAEPTYRIEHGADGTTIYHCLECQRTEREWHTPDGTLMPQHQDHWHGGVMVEEPSEAPAVEEASAVAEEHVATRAERRKQATTATEGTTTQAP
jgi:hypothetical protein